MTKTQLTTAAVAVLALAASGCGDDSGDGNGGGAGGSGGGGGGSFEDVDPCSLLSSAEIEAEVGNSVDDGDASPGGVCLWGAAALSDLEVTLTLHAPVAGSDAATLCTTLRADAESKGAITDVPAQGNGAWWEFRQQGSLSVGEEVTCVDAGVVSVRILGEGEEAKFRAAADALTQKVLGRVPTS